ncbi:MAG: sigma-70 family RNA polymerase sigma factor [Armatimonadota bacterium]|jgi:RNA polymerase sigma-70 factor (ECF subfamily)
MQRDLAAQNALVAAARDGDVGAFERLFRAHHVRIYNLMVHMVGDRTEAEDLTQSVFLRAWEHLERLRSTEAFTVWLHQLARNIARDHLRSRRSRAQHTTDDWDEARAAQVVDPSAEAQPEATVSRQATSEAVHAAVQSLPEHQREAIVLHHFEGMPVTDVAQVMGVQPGTVLSRLARGRDALRRKLAPLVEPVV